MATNVPQVAFGVAGFVPPPESQILAGVQVDINTAFGGGVNPALEAPQGQLASSEASIVGNVNDAFVYLTNQMDPAFAAGRMQDALGRIYFISRIPSAPTVLQVSCSGLTDVVIPVGALVVDGAQNQYACSGSGSIGVNGTVTLSFAAVVPGVIGVPSLDGISIYQAIPGWDGVQCLSGVVGNDTESRAQFEARREATVAANALGTLPAIKGSVLDVANVLDVYVVDNPGGSGVVIGGQALVAHSVYVAAVGGLDADVAQAIWRKKPPGCNYNGNTTVVVQDTSPGYSPPLPTYNVTFERPPALQILFAVSIVNSSQVPADALTQIQNALLAAFAGADGGARARIGSTLYAARYVAPIQALGAWAQVALIQVGSANSPSVTGAVGSISSNGTLTVTVAGTGVIAVGQTVLSNGTQTILPGTQITALGTGSGGTGTYLVNNAQVVPSGPIVMAKPAAASTVVNINQVPVLAAPNITVLLV